MIKLPYTLIIALRFSRGKTRKKIISLISIISTTGVALGVAVLLIGLSIINGFKHELKYRILSFIPHGQIIAINQPYLNWKIDIKKIHKTPGVTNVSPYINFTGLIKKKKIIKLIQINSIDLSSKYHLFSINKFISHDILKKIKIGNKHIILGAGIATKLNIVSGDTITLIIPNQKNKLYFQQPKNIIVKVIGIFKTNSMIDHQVIIMPLQDIQKHLKYKNGITGFQINVNNIFSVNKIIYDAGINTKHLVTIRTWIDDYGYIYKDIQMIIGIMYLSMILVLIIACFNIISILIMVIHNKRKDIAILKTIGAKDSVIHKIFLWYGLITGGIGLFFGLIIGILISVKLMTIIKFIEYILGYPIFVTNVYFIDFIPSEIQMIDIIYIIITILILSLIASWYPAKIATQINSVKLLNGQYK